MAHAMHLKVAAHAHGARGILAATNAGVDSIEHGTFLDEAGRAGDEGARHLLFGDADGVQRRPAAASAPASSRPRCEAKARQTFAVWGKGLNLAYRTGVKIALGTDSAVAPHSEAEQGTRADGQQGRDDPARRADRRDQGRPRPAWACRTRPERSIPASRPT